jgi:hypothetical protein
MGPAQQQPCAFGGDPTILLNDCIWAKEAHGVEVQGPGGFATARLCIASLTLTWG